MMQGNLSHSKKKITHHSYSPHTGNHNYDYDYLCIGGGRQQILKKKNSSIVASYRKYTSALTFESFFTTCVSMAAVAVCVHVCMCVYIYI